MSNRSARIAFAVALGLIQALAGTRLGAQTGGSGATGPPTAALGGQGDDALAGRPSPVQARLIADPPALMLPGAGRPSCGPPTVQLGLHLHMDPGWHTYWKNGGDAGLPTSVTWELPPGYHVSELQWPTPHRYEEAGDLVTYGYTDDVVLLATLTAAAEAPPGRPVRVKAAVSWLMCKELCIPGSATVTLDLPALACGEATPAATDAALFAAMRSRLPQPPAKLDGLQVRAALSLDAVPPGQRAQAALRIAGLAQPESTRVTWFPEYLETLELGAAIHRVLRGPKTPGSAPGAGVGELTIVIPVQVSEHAAAGDTLMLRGVVELAGASPAPRFLDVAIAVPVARADQAVTATDTDLFARVLSAEGGPETAGLLDGAPIAAPSGGRQRPVIYYLLLALVGGLILNVMPCVLPVLSLKVLGFVQHAGADRRTLLRLSLMFALGVLVSFLALALTVVALQAAGQQLGWGFQFQNPTFVVVMAAVVFAFALSMFGVYEVILPVQFGAGGHRGADAESFVSGLLATALATPCTAPFLGTALGFAFTQPAWAVLAIFLMIGLGLALPYVVLAANPAWLRLVPRPGPWMDRFKQGMGFLLMATMVWLLWVLGNQRGMAAVIWTMAFLCALGLALWLYGSFLNLSSSLLRRLSVWGAMLAIVVAAAWGFLRAPLRAEAIAGPIDGAAARAHPLPGDDGIAWTTFDLAALESAVRGGRTVFVDFTAQWCWTCKVNERTVLGDAAIRARLHELQVITMRGDWTSRDPVITQVLRRFGRSGVPFYAVFPAGRLDDPVVLPELITKEIVLDALAKAGPSRTALAPASAAAARGTLPPTPAHPKEDS